MKVILLFGIAGWGMMLLTCFFWDMESRGLEKKLASAEIEAQIWKERCDATVGCVRSAGSGDRAHAHGD